MIIRFAPLYFALVAGLLLGGLTTGCHHRSQPRFSGGELDCLATFSEIEYPDVCAANCGESLDGDHLRTGPPPTVSNFSEQEFWSLTLEEAIELTLANNKVLDKLGGRVIGAPAGLRTAYDPALLETSPFNSAEAALADFDAQFTGNATLDHTERKNNVTPDPTGFFPANTISNLGNLRAAISKTYANGSEFSVFSQSDYNRNNRPTNRFTSSWDTILRAEVRQPLAQGAGTAVNRIAGPNALPGQYNGVLIGRIRGDVALTDFEAAVRDLTRDVEVAYWELYFAYRNLDVAVQAREAARLIWDNRDKRVAAGLSRPDDEAQTRQQYFEFAQAAINALSGTTPTSGVLGAERELRRLIGLVNHDGQLIRPATEPTIAPVLFDWDQAQEQALAQRVELRRQKWLLRQRELELFAARKLNRWRVDALASVAARGFGDDLLGNTPGITEDSAFSDLWTGQLDDWGFGVEIRGPLGNRLGHLAIRNAELSVMREQAILREQQKQLLLDLNAAYNEVDRSFTAIGNQFNARTAVIEELESKRKRAVAGDEDVFFLLDAQRRAAVIESNFHRTVVDYNLALQNFVYTSGNLLENYNIQLIEGSWTSDAMADAASKNARFRYGTVNTNKTDICPISEGPVDQSTDLMIIYPESTAPADAPDSDAQGDDVPESANPDGNGPVSDLPEMPEPAMPDSGTDAAGN